MRKYKLLNFIFLLPISLFAQSAITESSVQKLFNNSRVEKHNGKFMLPSDKSWNFNNADSLYYKQDTITAILYKSTKHKNLCEMVNWTFYRKNAFIKGRESLCKEPPRKSVTKNPDDYFKIAIYNVAKETMIDVLRYDKMIVESFKVLNILESDEFTEIKLARRFNAN
jgi:hypothetical protein